MKHEVALYEDFANPLLLITPSLTEIPKVPSTFCIVFLVPVVSHLSMDKTMLWRKSDVHTWIIFINVSMDIHIDSNHKWPKPN